ncbi:MAG: formylmethanofuran dehydrogenase subunit B [Methanosarcinales archaeon]|nr:formylmethanofuran dehydrogenase subunit B [Methanosarcinales archaeon]
MEHSVTWTCTGCALLCEDIQVIINNNKIEKVENACLKGKGRLFGCKHPARSTINQVDADISEAISQAVRMLKESEHPLLYGWSNSTSEAQCAGIELAHTLGAVIDSTSSFCQGLTINEIITNNLPACTLEDVREKADVIMYWGADPMSSHPRHLSKYSYYPRGEMRQRGYEEDRTAICIDVRQSRTAKICKDKFYMIPAKGDAEFIKGLMDGLSGRVPKLDYEFDIKRILELAAILKKAEFGVIFVGLGLIYSIKSQMQLLLELINKLNEFSNFYLIPMAGHFNMRGFNHNMFEKTGFVHRVKFANEGIRSGIEFSVIEQLKNGADAAVIVGSDPLTSLPTSVSKRLKNIPVILIDPCMNLTSKVADITIPCSVSGIEVGGTAIRLDGQTQKISSLIESSCMSDELIIRRIIEELD